MSKRITSPVQASALYAESAGISLSLRGEAVPGTAVRSDRGGTGFLFEGTILASAEVERAGEFELYRWRLTNTGMEVSPPVGPLQVLSMELPCRGCHAPRLHGIRGGADDSRFPSAAWKPWSLCHPTEGLPAPDITAQSAEGRSSNDDAPFFVLEEAGRSGGWIFALGWSGDWQLRMRRLGEVSRIQIGMQHLFARLEPGESILQPELLVCQYRGTVEEARAKLRACLRDKLQPSLEGKQLRPFTWWDSYYGDRGTVTEASFLKTLGYCAEAGLDYVVLDGGWTGGGEDGQFFSLVPHIGSWRPDPKRFKQGFKNLVAAAQKHDRKLGLWLEIESANAASLAVREYPELFFPVAPPLGNHLLRLDTTQGLNWAAETISRNIEAAGAKWIRYDFNSNPATVWRAHDARERQGITECRYVENLYRLYELLLGRFPDLIIENCSSGGRRVDLGLVRRSHADWISDHSQSEAIIRSMIRHAGCLFPSHRLNSSFAHVYLEPNRPVDWRKPLPASAFLSHFGGNFGISDRLGVFGQAGRSRIRGYVDLFRKVAPCFAGEFYAFGDSDATERPGGIAGIDGHTGEAAVIVFGGNEGRSFEELPTKLNDLIRTRPTVSDSGSDQFVASALWTSV